MKKINLYSGPAILADEVLQRAQEALKDFAGSGLSILEVSHRSNEIMDLLEQTRSLAKDLMGLDEQYEVLFLHGGAASQFYMVPMNLLNEHETASYFDTGNWAHIAMEEAKIFGNVQVACSSRDKNYSYIPKRYQVDDNSKYLHITSNNTVYGTQFHWWPEVKCPMVVDMSSDIFSRQIDFRQFGLIYACAQKNLGTAGVTLVAVRKKLLGTVERKRPTLLNYQSHIDSKNLSNTPSTFSLYVSFLTLQWIKNQGIKKLEERNIRKANKLYAAIDNSSLFSGAVIKEDRSIMNVCFVINEKNMEQQFLDFVVAQGIVGIKGHRNVGGFRASIYNAMPESSVDVLIEIIKEFERQT